MNADAMKFSRDGHLWYGLPDKVTQRIRECVASGHAKGSWVQYGKQTMRCLNCLSFFMPDIVRSQLSERAT